MQAIAVVLVVLAQSLQTLPMSILSQISSNQAPPPPHVHKHAQLIAHACAYVEGEEPDSRLILSPDASKRDQLKEELPAYTAKVSDVNKDFDPLEWWKFNAPILPGQQLPKRYY